MFADRVIKFYSVDDQVNSDCSENSDETTNEYFTAAGARLQ